MANLDFENKTISPSVSKISMLVSAICMGNVGLLITFLSGYPIYTIVLFRGIFGALFLTLFMLKNNSFKKRFLKECFHYHWKALILLGLINAIVIYLYFVSITISGYAIAAFLLYTSGIFFLLLLIITKEEKVSKINIISFLLAIIGVAIIMEFWITSILNIGILTGLLSGLTLGILVFYKKKIYNKRTRNQSKIEAEGNFDMFLAWWPTLCLVIFFLPMGASDILRITMIDLIYCLILGFFPTALAFFLYNVGIKNDKGGNIIILSYFEPIMATINTFIFLKIISIYTIIGGAFILFANILVLKYSTQN